MPTASNLAGLKAMISAEVRQAMEEAASEIQPQMRSWIQNYFYSKGEPKIYERTYMMGDHGKTSPVAGGADSFQFDVYMDQYGLYHTGDFPSMSQVLDLSNYGIQWTTKGGALAKPNVGGLGWWEAMEPDIENKVDECFARHFD